MREVRYNGGMVVFSVPDSWHETTYRDGGASYFEGDGEKGSLYVTLTTAEQDAAVGRAAQACALHDSGPPEEVSAAQRASKPWWRFW